MARMPGVTWAPVNDANAAKAMTRYDVICVHTIVGHDPANAAHFSTGSDGMITQSRDTWGRSAANFDGNYRVIAIENEDLGPEYGDWNVNDGHQVPGFTPTQVEAIAQICAWVHLTHGIPLEACPDSKPYSRGVAYHRQGIDGNFAAEGYAYPGRVSGGEVWSEHTGKVCPGDRRIKQVLKEIIPRARVLAGLEQDVSDWVEARLYALDQMQEKVSPGPNADRAGIVGEPVPMVTELKYIAMRLYRFLLLNPDQSGGSAPPSEGPLPAIDALVYTRDTVKQIAETLTGLSVAGADPAVIADHLAGDDGWTQRLAEAVAVALDNRAHDGNPATGPTT